MRNRYRHKVFLQIKAVSIYTLTIALFLLANPAKSQPSFPDALKQRFVEYSENMLQEKIFVHTDKAFYLGGEIIWFKAYLVDASFHKPLDISKIAYVEVVNNNNQPVLQAKISLKEGKGDGSFFLPATIPSGVYKFRAYTKWMMNFPIDFFFEKLITIVNTKIPYRPSDTSAVIDNYVVHFFPEGGNLVSNLESKIAFLVSGGDIAAGDCSGAVVDEQNDTITSFRSSRPGIGSFSFAPRSNMEYRVSIKLPSGKIITGELPTAYTEGYVMRLDRIDDESIGITVQSTNSSPVYLLAHTRGVIKLVLVASIQNGIAKFEISKDSLGDGVTHFTLFNGDRKPVCERLFWKQPEKKLDVDVQSSKASYEPREKILLDVLCKDETGRSAFADMSMAVYRVDSLQSTDPVDINNYLWLATDLPGFMPGRDFNSTTLSDPDLMDAIMLTHGWRRFRWDEVFNEQKPVFQFAPEFEGHTIHGTVTNSTTNSAANGINAFLTVPGVSTNYHHSTSDSSGNIKFQLKNFQGVSEIIVQTDAPSANIYRIDIQNPFSTKYSSIKMPSFKLPANDDAELLNQSISAQVHYVFAGQKQRLVAHTTDTIPFYHKPDMSYLLDNYTRFTTMEEVFREYIMPVFVTRQNGKPNIYVYDGTTRTAYDQRPLMLVDGLPVFSSDKLMSYDPLKVRKIDVVSQRYFLGSKVYYGIVNLVTYEGNLEGYELDRDAIVLDYEGLQLQRAFHSPVYETTEQVNSRLPDFRNLLYWSPNVKINHAGKQPIQFYSSDLPGRYAIVVQGITPEGRTGSKTVLIEVK